MPLKALIAIVALAAIVVGLALPRPHAHAEHPIAQIQTIEVGR